MERSTCSFKRNYGVGNAKKDFGLHSTRVALPDIDDVQPDNYSQTMPGYALEQRLERGKTTIRMEASPPPPQGEREGKTKTSWTKKMRELFKSGSTSQRKAKGESASGEVAAAGSPSHLLPQQPVPQEQRPRPSTWSHERTKGRRLTRPVRSLGNPSVEHSEVEELVPETNEGWLTCNPAPPTYLYAR